MCYSYMRWRIRVKANSMQSTLQSIVEPTMKPSCMTAWLNYQVQDVLFKLPKKGKNMSFYQLLLCEHFQSLMQQKVAKCQHFDIRSIKYRAYQKRRSWFWKRLILIIMFLMIDSSNLQEFSLTLSSFVSICLMSGHYLAYFRTKMLKFRKLYNFTNICQPQLFFLSSSSSYLKSVDSSLEHFTDIYWDFHKITGYAKKHMKVIYTRLNIELFKIIVLVGLF